MAQEPNELTRGRTDTRGESGKRDPDEILADIRRTRAEMSVTAGEVRTRLAPDRLKAQVKEQMREVTVGRAKNMAENMSMKAKGYSRSMTERIKDNPIPAAMTAVGIGWLMWSSRKEKREERRGYDYGYLVSSEGLRTDYPEYMETASPCGPTGIEASPGMRSGAYESHGARIGEGEQARGKAEELKQRAGETVEDYKQRMSQYRERLGEKTQEMRERVSETAQEYRQRLGESAQQYRERMSDMAQRSRESARHYYASGREHARHAGHNLQRRYDHNPLGMGLAAMALGAVAGLAIKESRWEHETMGQYRDQVLDTAKEAGRERLQQVREVASETIQEARETAGEKMHQARERMEAKAEEAESRQAGGQGIPERLADPRSEERARFASGTQAGSDTSSRTVGDTRPRSENMAQEEPAPMDKPSKVRSTR